MPSQSPFIRPTRKLICRVSLAIGTIMFVIAVIFVWKNQKETDEEPKASATNPNLEIEQVLHSQPPFTFIENKGQWPERVKFVAQDGNMTAWIENNAITLQLEKQDGKNKKGVVTRLAFVGASDGISLEGDKKQPGQRSYFIGNDRSKWQSGVTSYSQVLYRGLYPGIDMRLRPHEGNLEYDLLLQPGADLEQVVIQCSGTDGLELQPDGSLVINTSLGPIRQKVPLTWYEHSSGEKEIVECQYEVLDAERFGFVIPDLNPALAVVIDPGLEYATYLGGGGGEVLAAGATGAGEWAMDEAGNLFFTGTTRSPNFPVTAGAYQTELTGFDVAFVTCFNPSLNGAEQLVWSTFLGGSASDAGFAAQIDTSGNILVGGLTGAPDFPTTSDAFDTTYGGGALDGFLTVLDASGSQLLYSTFIGGGDDDRIVRVKLDPILGLTIAGQTASPDFPITPTAYDTSFNGEVDGFVARLDLSLTREDQLIWSTFLGGSGEDLLYDMEIDAAGDVYVAGDAGSRDFPTTPGAFSESYNGGNFDAFLARFSTYETGLAQLSYATFLGGSLHEVESFLVLQGDGEVWLHGTTGSADFPVTAGAYDESYNGGNFDLYISRLDLNQTGKSQLTYSTFLGGLHSEFFAKAMAIDDSGRVIIGGATPSGDFPTTTGAHDTLFGGGIIDVTLSRLNPAKSGRAQLEYSTYLGGNFFEWPELLALDDSGAYLVAGVSISSDFPTTPDAFDRTHNGAQDLFVAKVRLEPTPLPAKALFASLDGQQEVAPVATTGSGSGRVSLSADYTALDYEIAINDLVGNITAVRFNAAPTGSNGPIVRTVFDNGLVAGDTTLTGVWKIDDPEPLNQDRLAELCQENIYVNVHTDAFPDGEIRGQLVFDPFPGIARAAHGPFYATLGKAGDNGGLLITIDPQTGAGSPVAHINESGNDFPRVVALAVNSQGQAFVYYGAVFQADHPLYRVDAATAAATRMGLMTMREMEAMAFDFNDVLYGINDTGRLVRIDDKTGRVSIIGQVAVDIKGMAFDPTDGTLWGSKAGTQDRIGVLGGIYTIDVNSAKATLVGRTGFDNGMPGLHFDDDGNLFAVTGGGKKPNDLIAIDKATGKGSVVGPIGYVAVSALAKRHAVVQGPQVSLNAKTINLGHAELGTSVSNDITVTNYGTEALSITAISASGAPFAVTDLPALPVTIQPHRTASFKVTFSPTVEGTASGALTITSNDADSPTHETTVIGGGVELSVVQPGVMLASTGNQSTGDILQVDPKTGVATRIEPSGLHSIPALAINTQGEIFAVDHNLFIGSLYRIDANSGAAVEVGSTGLFGTIEALAFDGGDVLYAVSSRLTLSRIDTETGALSEVGPLAAELAGLAFDPTDGRLLACTGTETDQIFTLDPETAQATLIGVTGLGGGTFDLAFDAAGTLYGVKRGKDNSTLISIDKATGTGTVIGDLGFRSVAGLATRLTRKVITSVEEKSLASSLPKEFTLAQNYPNPFNPSTTIRYELPKSVHVKLVIYDILGRTVRTLVDEEQPPGVRQKLWDGRNEAGVPVATGLYLYRIQAGDFVQSRKMMVIK